LKTNSDEAHQDWLIERHNWTSNCHTQYFSHHPFLFKRKGGFLNPQYHYPIFPIFMVFLYSGYGDDPENREDPRIPRSTFPPCVYYCTNIYDILTKHALIRFKFISLVRYSVLIKILEFEDKSMLLIEDTNLFDIPIDY